MELTRHFDCSETELTAALEGFPGTWRIYGVDRSPGWERNYVEFRTTDLDAAKIFLTQRELEGMLVV